MKKRNVSIILFIKDNKVLLQDRRNISKHGEEYGFFGGKIEKDETPGQALKREIKEELNFDIVDYTLFKKYHHVIKEIGRDVIKHVYIAKIPDLNIITVNEGRLALMKFEDSFKLKMISGDVDLLKEIFESLRNKK
mgnify:CR=1 FL=1